MKKVNFEAIKEHISTKYGDLTGLIQIDGHSNITSIYKLCEDNKFDTNNIFIIGFGLGESTMNGVGKTDSLYCSILYVEKDVYGNSFEEIKRKINNDGVLRIKKKSIEIKYSELGKYIKRFDFLTTTELADYATQIEIDEVEE